MILVEKPAGKKALERHSRKWADNNKMDFKDMGWGHGLN
jgi:hypothetical protein